MMNSKNYYYLIKKGLSLDQVFAIIVLIAGLFVSLLSIWRGHYGVVLPVILVLSSSVYLIFKQRLIRKAGLSSISTGKNYEILNHIIYLLSLSASLWLLWSHLYSRPLLYFILVVIAAGSIIFSIIRLDPSKTMSIAIILIKVIILSGSIYAGKYYEFFGIYGVDPWWHNIAIQQTIDQGHITGEYLLGSYYYEFPLFHILGSITRILSGLSVYTSVFISVGLALCISCVFIFLIFKRIFDTRTSLLATVISSLSAYTIQISSAIIPMSLGFFFFLVIIYLISYWDMGRWQNSLLFVLISAAIILTHTIAALLTLLALVSYYVGFKVCKSLNKGSMGQQSAPIYLIVFFGIAMLMRWNQVAPNGQSFLSSMYSSFTQSLDVGIVTVLAEYNVASGVSYINQNLNQGAYLILLTLGLIGTFIYLHTQNRTPSRMGIVSALLVLTIVPYSFQFFNLPIILPDRWFLFLSVPLSMMAVLALVSLFDSLENSLKILTVSFTTMGIIFLSITNSAANDDNPLIYNGSQRIGYTKSEITAVKTLAAINTGKLETDLYFGAIWPEISSYYDIIVPSLLDHNTQAEDPRGNCYLFVKRKYYLAHPEWNSLYTQSFSLVNTNITTRNINIVQYMEQKGINKGPIIYSNGNVTVYSCKIIQ